jgi:hypothetical protein
MNDLILKKAEKSLKGRKDRKKAEKPFKSRIFLLKAEEVVALDAASLLVRVRAERIYVTYRICLHRQIYTTRDQSI